jgi:hypothetical protein
VIVLIAGYMGWDVYSEAYGPGPPFYGRTENMDKWSDPLAALLTIAAIAALAVLGLALIGRRLRVFR